MISFSWSFHDLTRDHGNHINYISHTSFPPAWTKLKGGGGYTDFTLFTRPSVCLPVRLWTESCPLHIVHNTSHIYLIFTHLINQYQKVCHVLRFSKNFAYFFLDDFNLGFSRSNFEIGIFQDWWSDWHGTKVIWINMMVDSLYDLNLWSQPWFRPWIFKVKLWNSSVLRMAGSDSFEFVNIKDVNSGMGKMKIYHHHVWRGFECDPLFVIICQVWISTILFYKVVPLTIALDYQ